MNQKMNLTLNLTTRVQYVTNSSPIKNNAKLATLMNTKAFGVMSASNTVSLYSFYLPFFVTFYCLAALFTFLISLLERYVFSIKFKKSNFYKNSLNVDLIEYS